MKMLLEYKEWMCGSTQLNNENKLSIAISEVILRALVD